MILRITKSGRTFSGVLNYCLDPAKAPEIIAATMAGENAPSLAREFRHALEAKEAIRKPVFHASLSADPGDQLTADQWRQIAESLTERMGFGNSLWVAIRHRDRDHDHLHIVASRIGHDGSLVDDWKDYRRGDAIVRDLEREYGLRQVAPSHEAERSAPSRGDLAVFERTGRVSVNARLQELVELAARGRPTMGEFAERLEALRVGVRFNLAKTGRVTGISYDLDEIAVKGSRLGPAYSWDGLQRRLGVGYDSERDLPALRARSQVPIRRAARQPRRAEPRAEPMPKLDEPARAFREAAVLASRVEVHERVQMLDDAQRQVADACFKARQLLAERERTARRLDSREQAIFDHLGRVYKDPRAAGGRVRELIDTQGYEQAARALGEAPAQLGRLHGVGVGNLHSETRSATLAATSWLSRELRDVGRERARLAASAPQAEKAAADLEAAEGMARRLSRLRRHLPDPAQLDKELLRAAQALGTEAVKGMSGLALGVVTRLKKKEKLAHDRARDSDLSLGK